MIKMCEKREREVVDDNEDQNDDDWKWCIVSTFSDIPNREEEEFASYSRFTCREPDQGFILYSL